MPNFRALIAERDEQGEVTATVQDVNETLLGADDLADGDLLVRVQHSSLNYKDGLAVLGRPGVVRKYPIIPGIDVVGIVERSNNPQWTSGDRIVVNGAGLGESRHGGFAELAVVPGSAAVAVPQNLSSWAAAAAGTAGDTAALSVLALEAGGVAPKDGDILVTGAAGGVGTVAISLLSRAGFRVIASTGRVEAQGAMLRELGAADVIDRAELSSAGRPLQAVQFAGVIDSVGGPTLATALSRVGYGGVVTCCGLAHSADLPATVLPFILRGITLTGIDSVNAPPLKRRAAWDRLATALDEDLLRSVSTEIGLDEVLSAGERILAGQIAGRTVVTP